MASSSTPAPSPHIGQRGGPRRRLDIPTTSTATAPPPPPPLLALPAEILSLVLAALPPVELARAMAVCRGLREPAADTKLWLPHCRAQWPQDDFSDGAACPGRFGARHRLFARLVVCSTGVDRMRVDAAAQQAARGQQLGRQKERAHALAQSPMSSIRLSTHIQLNTSYI